MQISFKHRLGNVISALVSIAECVVIVLSLSFILPRWNLKFLTWRVCSGFLADRPEPRLYRPSQAFTIWTRQVEERQRIEDNIPEAERLWHAMQVERASGRVDCEPKDIVLFSMLSREFFIRTISRAL